MLSKEDAYHAIEQLVIRFGEQIHSYKKTDYNETLVRRDFIDPFFKALGWDVDNSQGYAEAYREVIHEDRIKVGKATKAPDYSFRLPGGKRLFFVEAKKPSVAVKTDIVPAYQVRRYAWSAKLPISLLTDFEELAVYDCNKKPKPEDKASIARIKYLTYNEYLAEFDFLWDTFSKERVLKGSFDKFIASDSNKKGTTTVDKDFLASLDEWRMELAQNIALRNGDYTEEELNFTVQQTIDRIIFLRIAEDRGVEEYGRLQGLLKGESIYNNLYQYFTEADGKYNSGLFDFKRDKLSQGLLIDNKVLKAVITELYYPVSPYEFSVLSVEILGSAYEQFLGKQIKLNSRHKIEVDEKPEVRKAGGVYYTPQYIVDYIVKQTVGKLAESKTPEQVSKLRIVDPACGSGSFLIGAYQYLLTWHHQYYKPEFIRLTEEAGNAALPTKQREAAIKQRNKLPLTPDGGLTTAIKKTILLNNIYGVDIDTQAVEVTKLSLLLKCMEGETQSSMSAEMRFGERILPTLDSNIKSGNSLIDLDFYDGQIDFEPEVEKKIKPFSWEQNFKEVFKGGGFDCVIGNPPYVRQEMLGDQKPYFQKAYKVYHGMADLYSYFFERGIELLKPNGLFAIIVANKWMRANYGEPLRRWFKEQSIKQIIDFGDLPVFQSATTYPCIIIAAPKGKTADSTFEVTNITTLKFESLEQYVLQHNVTANTASLQNDGWNLGSEGGQALLEKIKTNTDSFKQFTNGKLYIGLKTGLNEAFIVSKSIGDNLIKDDNSLKQFVKPYLVGRDIKRYQKPTFSKYLILIPAGWSKANSIDGWKSFENMLPTIAKHLEPFEEKAIARTDQGDFWWELRSCIYYPEFEKDKIIFSEIATQGQFIIDDQRLFSDMTTFIIGNNSKYLLGILNSRLITFYFATISSSIRGGFLRWKRQYVEIIPIKKIDKQNKSLADMIIKLVDNMLSLTIEKGKTTLPQKLEDLQQRIAYTDDRINKLVYKLYELTDEEIKVIETV